MTAENIALRSLTSILRTLSTPGATDTAEIDSDEIPTVLFGEPEPLTCSNPGQPVGYVQREQDLTSELVSNAPRTAPERTCFPPVLPRFAPVPQRPAYKVANSEVENLLADAQWLCDVLTVQITCGPRLDMFERGLAVVGTVATIATWAAFAFAPILG